MNDYAECPKANSSKILHDKAVFSLVLQGVERTRCCCLGLRLLLLQLSVCAYASDLAIQDVANREIAGKKASSNIDASPTTTCWLSSCHSQT